NARDRAASTNRPPKECPSGLCEAKPVDGPVFERPCRREAGVAARRVTDSSHDAGVSQASWIRIAPAELPPGETSSKGAPRSIARHLVSKETAERGGGPTACNRRQAVGLSPT